MLSSGIKDETELGKAQRDAHSLRVIHPWLRQTRPLALTAAQKVGVCYSHGTQTRVPGSVPVSVPVSVLCFRP